MIKTVTLGKVKGVSGRFELGKVNLVLGRNGAGKTAIMDAVVLCLCGFHPEHGSRAGSIMDALASGSQMTVVTTHANGDVRALTFSRKGAGGSIEATIPEGRGFYPPHVASLTEWLSLTAAKRTEFVCRIASAGQMLDLDKVLEQVRRLVAADEAEQQAKEDVIQCITEVFGRSTNPALTLSESITALAERASALKRSVADLAGKARVNEVQAGMEVFSQSGPVPTRDEIEAATARLAELNQVVGELQGAQAAYEAARKRSESAALELEDLAAQLDQLPSLIEASATAVERAAAALARLEKPARSKAEHDGTVMDLRLKKSAAERELKLLRDKLSEHEARADEVLCHDTCPTCHSAGSGWQAEFKRWHLEIFGGIADQIEAAKLKLESLESALAKAVTDAEIDQGLASAIEDATEQLNAEKEELTRLNQKKASIGKRCEDLVMSNQHPRQVANEELAKAKEEADAARTALQTLSARFNQAAKEEAMKEQAAKEQVELNQLEANHKLFKLAATALKELQQVIANHTITPVLERARLLIGGVVPWELLYENGEFGYKREGRWVSMSSFSGAEKRVAFAGIQMAFAMSLPERIVMVDEIGTLCEEWQERLISTVKKLIENGVIHQFIGIGTSLSPVLHRDQDLTILAVKPSAN